MKRLDHFLDQATRGLPDNERKRCREELRSSILERSAELQVGGLAAPAALTSALREFGDPRSLGSGLRGVHLWPKLYTFGGLSALTLAFGLTVLPPSRPPLIGVTTEGNIPLCEYTSRRAVAPRGKPYCTTTPSFWVNLNEFTGQLRQQGASVTVTSRAAASGLPEDDLTAHWQDAKGEHRSFTVQVSRREVQHELDQYEALRSQGQRTLTALPQNDVLMRKGQVFLNGETLIASIQRTSSATVTLEHPLDSPVLSVGDLRFKLGEPGQGVSAQNLIYETLSRQIHDQHHLFVRRVPLPVLDTWNTRYIRTGAAPGTLFAVIITSTQENDPRPTIQLGTVDQDGLLKFKNGAEPLKQVSQFRNLDNAGGHHFALLSLGRHWTINESLLTPLAPRQND